MEKNQQCSVDLLEIYHARQVRDQIISQLRRLRSSQNQQQLPFHDLQDSTQQREVRGYYEALLLTVAELLHLIGDDDLAN